MIQSLCSGNMKGETQVAHAEIFVCVKCYADQKLTNNAFISKIVSTKRRVLRRHCSHLKSAVPNFVSVTKHLHSVRSLYVATEKHFIKKFLHKDSSNVLHLVPKAICASFTWWKYKMYELEQSINLHTWKDVYGPLESLNRWRWNFLASNVRCHVALTSIGQPGLFRLSLKESFEICNAE